MVFSGRWTGRRSRSHWIDNGARTAGIWVDTTPGSSGPQKVVLDFFGEFRYIYVGMYMYCDSLGPMVWQSGLRWKHPARSAIFASGDESGCFLGA